MAQQDKLAAFLRELLSGTVDIGVTMIPLIGLFKRTSIASYGVGGTPMQQPSHWFRISRTSVDASSITG